MWWSWALAAIGVFGLYLTTRKLWAGFAVGVAVQVLWIAYALTTHQYGFIASAIAYGAVNSLGLYRWTRTPKEGTPRMTQQPTVGRPQRFRKKPIEIEAMQWDGTAEGATPIIDWVLANGGTATYRCDNDEGCGGTAGTHYLVIQTLEGPMPAAAGWWIIRGIEGEFYPCKPSVFAATYEPVDTERVRVENWPNTE